MDCQQSDIGHSMQVVEVYFREAVRVIDSQFRTGHAKHHPELVRLIPKK